MVSSSPSSPSVTKYVESDGVNIAYRACGDGPLDLIYVPGLISHIEAFHRSEASVMGVEVIRLPNVYPSITGFWRYRRPVFLLACRGLAAYDRALRGCFGCPFPGHIIIEDEVQCRRL